MVRNVLQVAGYSGTAEDRLQYGSEGDNLNGTAFSTPDRDNDLYSGGSCALDWKGECLYVLTTEWHLPLRDNTKWRGGSIVEDIHRLQSLTEIC